MTYFASTCFNYSDLNSLLQYCQDQKNFRIELSGNLGTRKDTLASLSKANDFSFLIHNYFPAPEEPFVLNLASADANIRKRSLDHCRQALNLCQMLNIPFYSVHAGFLVDLDPNDLGSRQTDQPRINRADGLKNFTDSINQLLKETEIDLLVENNVNSLENLVEGRNELYLLAEPEETLDFFRNLNHPRLGLLADLGHLNVSAQQLKFDKYQYLEDLHPWIKAFHLSANNGISDQGLHFRKDEWFIKELKKFPKALKIIEISKQSQKSDLRRCQKIVDNL